MAKTTPQLIPLIAAGSQVVVRDEEWLVRAVQATPADGMMVRCLGVSELVRDTEAIFFTDLDAIVPLQPEKTELVVDDTPGFRRSRLYLEAVVRKTPLPARETRLAVGHLQLLNELEFQKRAVAKALQAMRPRLLIADAVGLGKTLEVGMILSELIRRGRGERILVVTPRHILEQFQHELWTRFAIPLVRLDSEGIQRVRQKIPATRNPFTYYKRAIISVDTLKNAGRYRHHLESIHWDAVVIDECHNVANRAAMRNQVARVLAPRTEALILTSATPHNGDPQTFAELIRLLDPTAIADPTDIQAHEIKHLYVRRHKNHDEVSAEVGSKWADRLEPQPLLINASPQENALFTELADVWVHPQGPPGSPSGKAPTSGDATSLFPWTLVKAALSSHRALAQTIEQRRKTLATSARAKQHVGLTAAQEHEDDALQRLGDLCAQITDASSAKLQALLDQLRQAGVGPGSRTRVVVFSERIATLQWLAHVVPKALGLEAKKHVRELHGGLADVKQMDVIEEFGLAESPVRLLFTGDMASEGVNLHRQCHHLIHYDLPWSLITIEQRNGRIDRYGQEHAPDIRALLLTPSHPRLTGDVRVLTKLLEREHQAHKAFGESGSLLGVHTADREEEQILKALAARAACPTPDALDVDALIPAVPTKAFDLLTLLSGGTGLAPVATAPQVSLFADDRAFIAEALRSAFVDATRDLQIETEPHLDPGFFSIVPPADLQRRFQALPQSYLTEQKVLERIRLTTTRTEAEHQLAAARERTDSTWPTVGFCSSQHPFVDWLLDKLLVEIGRNQAPVIVTDVATPIYCLQGMYSNGRGQPQIVEWMAVTPEPTPGAPRTTTTGMTAGATAGARVRPLFDVLAEHGLTGATAPPNTHPHVDLAPIAAGLPAAVSTARAWLEERRAARDEDVVATIVEQRRRLDEWKQRSFDLLADLDEIRRRQRSRQIETTAQGAESLIESLRTAGQPLVRVLAVLAGRSS